MKLVLCGYWYCTEGSKTLKQICGNGKNETYDPELKDPLVLLKCDHKETITGWFSSVKRETDQDNFSYQF